MIEFLYLITFVAYIAVPASLWTDPVFRVTRDIPYTVSTLGQTLVSVCVQGAGWKSNLVKIKSFCNVNNVTKIMTNVLTYS